MLSQGNRAVACYLKQPLKVIQGHHSWYQMRAICNFMWAFNINCLRFARFQRYYQFFVLISIFPYSKGPPVFHLEFWYDPLAAGWKFFATH